MKNSQKSSMQPKTKKELHVLIEAKIKKNGDLCDLNHIDVSLITDFSDLFFKSKFNGDISRWDVSKAENMRGIFEFSKFNGDISGWDVSGVKNMNDMFYGSKFNGELSRWNVSGVTEMGSMFGESEFKGDVSSWNRFSIINDVNIFLDSKMAKKIGTENPGFEQVKSHFLNLKLEADLQRLPEQSGPSRIRL